MGKTFRDFQFGWMTRAEAEKAKALFETVGQ
jgi:hypothetical protein